MKLIFAINLFFNKTGRITRSIAKNLGIDVMFSSETEKPVVRASTCASDSNKKIAKDCDDVVAKTTHEQSSGQADSVIVSKVCVIH